MAKPKIYSPQLPFYNCNDSKKLKDIQDLQKEAPSEVDSIMIECESKAEIKKVSPESLCQRLKITYPSWWFPSYQIYLHPFNDALYYLNEEANRLLKLCDGSRRFLDITREMHHVDLDELIGFLILLIRLDLICCRDFDGWPNNIKDKNPDRKEKTNLDVLLINPNDWRTPLHYFMPSPNYPLGLGYIGTILKNTGYKTKIWDLGLAPSWKKVRRTIEALNPKIAGISAMTNNFPSAVKLARLIKSINPDILTVMGGIHPTFACREILKKNPAVDVICFHEGEYTMLDLTQAHFGNEDLAQIEGIAFRKNDKATCNSPKQPIQDLDKLPFPDRDLSLIPITKLRELDDFSFTIIASRGCPYRCSYCSTSNYWGIYRFRSPINVVDEIEWLEDKYGMGKIKFLDDVFTLRRNWVLELCREIKNRGLDVEWSLSTRVDLVNQSLLKAMKNAGCKAIFYGLESLNDPTLQSIRKGTTKNQIAKTIRQTKEAGIEYVEAFMLGLPREGQKDLKEKMEFITQTRSKLDRANFCILKLLPQTEIHSNPESDGIYPYSPPVSSYYGGLGVYTLKQTESLKPQHILESILLPYLDLHRPLPWYQVPTPQISQKMVAKTSSAISSKL